MIYHSGTNQETVRTFLDYVFDLRKTVSHYQKNLLGRRIQFILADGNAVVLSFNKECFSHLAGINFNYLKTLPGFSDKNSYECVLHLLKHYESFIPEIESGEIKLNSLFSFYYKDKLHAILTLPPMDHNAIHKTAFVCKYDKKVFSLSGLAHPVQTDYLVAFRNRYLDYCVLGVLEDPEDKKMHLNSILNLSGRTQSRRLDDIIGYQTITFPIHCVATTSRAVTGVDAEPKQVFLQEHARINKIEQLLEFSREYHTQLNTSGDMVYQLNRVIDFKERNYELQRILNILSLSLDRNIPIPTDLLETLPSEYRDMLLKFNRLIDEKEDTDEANIQL